MKPDVAILETTQCLCLASRRAARAITREFDWALRAHGLRATQFTLLSALHLTGPQAIGELAELLSLDRTTLTRNLAIAQTKGWLTVRVDRDDGRSRLAEFTTKGSRTLSSALPTWRKPQQNLLEAIGARTAPSLRTLAGGPCVSAAPTTVHSRLRKEAKQ